MVSFFELFAKNRSPTSELETQRSRIRKAPVKKVISPDSPLPIVLPPEVDPTLPWANETIVAVSHYDSIPKSEEDQKTEPLRVTLKVYSQLTYPDAVRLGQELTAMYQPLSQHRFTLLPHLDLDSSGILFMLRPNVILVTAEQLLDDGQQTKIIGFLLFGENLEVDLKRPVELESLAVVIPSMQNHGITYEMTCRALEQAQRKYGNFVLIARTIGGYAALESLRDHLFAGLDNESFVRNRESYFQVNIPADWQWPPSTHLVECVDDT